ncbi:MAG: bifunctional adenosylcobinamide kinase/adenosylcobinamide-phosphate guanylyltransferase [Gemmatimonadaceae bacterium]|nr:bifunctional adenosylcobinamide kinase/adenosylcobinamide-phosphate guanylyltransferase [Gemmatimonadaceae bacterium]
MNTAHPCITFYLGGVRAGKSARAQAHAESIAGAQRIFIATAQAFDDEMTRRIAKHREDRGEQWHTIEEPIAIVDAITNYMRSEQRVSGQLATVVLIDCLTLWVSNLLLALPETDHATQAEHRVADAARALAALMQAHSQVHWIVVSNEVGLGVVPPTPLGRAYRDALGRANQILAEAAEHVQLMVAGLELRLK